MRILLIAYDYPPCSSPQSIRWTYLSRELSIRGFNVEVLTVDAPGSVMLRTMRAPENVTVHRTASGLISKLAEYLLRRHMSRSTGSVSAPIVSGAASSARMETSTVKLNWKGRLVEALQKAPEKLYFPDARGEWLYFARRRLRSLLKEFKPDVVVSSHEPATTLELGRDVVRAGIPWIADLGDPVFSFYTPERWKKRARKLERWVCCNSQQVVVTTMSAKRLLASRHGVDEGRFSVLTQGFDAVAPDAQSYSAGSVDFDADKLELLYTGSFYSFRHPQALIDAVLACPSARLTVAASALPGWMSEIVRSNPEKIRYLGFVNHGAARVLQCNADVLVNIANDDLTHIPGKVYEYLGAGRPVLHIGNQSDDPINSLITDLRRGLVCGNDSIEIGRLLARLFKEKLDGSMQVAFDLSMEAVRAYSWQALGQGLARILQGAVK